MVEDALASNAPHIRELEELNLRYILGAKPGDHKALFADLAQAAKDEVATQVSFIDPEDRQTGHFFKFVNRCPLNKSNLDQLVNVLEYSQIDKNEKITTFSWVSGIELTKENAYRLMRAGRARWKIESEIFNTLKNQDFNLGYNYGLGKKRIKEAVMGGYQSFLSQL